MRFVTTMNVGVVALLAALGLMATTPALDGARVVNSGSTNTAPWTLTIRSDGSGIYTIGQRRFGAAPAPLAPHPIAVPSALAQRLLADAKAAREAGAQGGHCMKSASFGSTTILTYHGWASGDLQCPSPSAALDALAADVAAVQKAANLNTMPRPVRIPPNELRRPNPLASP